MRDAILQSLFSLSLKYIFELVALFLVDDSLESQIWVLIVLRVGPGCVYEELGMSTAVLMSVL